MNQLRAKRDSMRDSRGGLFSYRDFKKPPISIYTIYYFLVFPVKILSPFPTRRPSERPPAPAARLVACYCTTHHPGTLTTHSHSALNAQYLTPTEGACTDMAEDAATATPASLVRISFAAPRPCLRELQLLPITFVCTFLMSIIPPPPLPPSPSRLPLLLLFCRRRRIDSLQNIRRRSYLMWRWLVAVAPALARGF